MAVPDVRRASTGGPRQLHVLLRCADEALREGARDEALALLALARAQPAPAIDRYAVGEALLRASNGRRGWDLYDLHPSRPVDQLPNVQRWNGERCHLLVLLAEQGFGDAIQFLRFVAQVSDHADEVILAVHDDLLDVVAASPLLRGCTTMSKSAARRTTWPGSARWERLMSVPSRIQAPEVGPAEPYLHVGAPDGNYLSPAPGGCITIGVAWRSTPRRGFPNRSFPARLVRHLVVPGRSRVFPLHRNKDIKALPAGVEIAQIGNFVDTAHVISQCDYVVTPDTVTAHLAPALGVPTLVCLRHRADWRWGTARYPTRWYAKAELLFQDESETWAPVLATAARRILGRDAPGASPASAGAEA